MHIKYNPTDLDQRSQTCYTAPCIGVVSHGALTGGVRVFIEHTFRKHNKMSPRSLLAFQCLPHVYLHALTTANAGNICTWQIQSWLFWILIIARKNLNTPNWSSMPGREWRWFLNLWSKSVYNHMSITDHADTVVSVQGTIRISIKGKWLVCIKCMWVL